MFFSLRNDCVGSGARDVHAYVGGCRGPTRDRAAKNSLRVKDFFGAKIRGRDFFRAPHGAIAELGGPCSICVHRWPPPLAALVP